MQGFYSYRIYLLSKKVYVGILFCIMCFVTFAGSMTVFIGGVTSATFAEFLEKWGDPGIAVLAVGAATDVSIALALVILLSGSRIARFEK